MKIKHIAIATFGMLIFLGAGCQSSTAPAIQTPVSNQPAVQSPVVTPPAQPTPTAKATVSISNFAFNPATLTVKKGTSVTWTNSDPMAHTITSDNGAFASSQLSPGQRFYFTFIQAGTFSYYCAIHPSMTATVVVTE